MCSSRILHLAKILDKSSLRRLRNSALAAQNMENRWMQKLDTEWGKLDDYVWECIISNGHPPRDLRDFFRAFYAEHAFESMALGMRTAESREQETSIPYGAAKKLSLPGARIPRGFKDLMELWDKWRKKRQLPKRQQVLADRVAKAYLNKVQSVWEKHSRDFRVGDAVSQRNVRIKIMEAADTTYSRARTIVQTETTYYYNRARIEYYDRSPDVEYYLFVAVRDSATTKWCKTRQGIVFTKGSKLFLLNRPPCHWNCRSEVLPLSTKNPAHLAIINDLTRRAENVKMEPLPAGWNKRVA